MTNPIAQVTDQVRAMPQAARAGRAAHEAPAGLRHSATIPIAKEK